jgi:hypothetical protein
VARVGQVPGLPGNEMALDACQMQVRIFAFPLSKMLIRGVSGVFYIDFTFISGI